MLLHAQNIWDFMAKLHGWFQWESLCWELKFVLCSITYLKGRVTQRGIMTMSLGLIGIVASMSQYQLYSIPHMVELGQNPKNGSKQCCWSTGCALEGPVPPDGKGNIAAWVLGRGHGHTQAPSLQGCNDSSQLYTLSSVPVRTVELSYCQYGAVSSGNAGCLGSLVYIFFWMTAAGRFLPLSVNLGFQSPPCWNPAFSLRLCPRRTAV